jgi:hypothetical protein
LTAIIALWTEMDMDPEEILRLMVPQKNEVGAIFLMTFERMKERIHEFVPGIQKMLPVMKVGEGGVITWTD